MVTNCNQLKMKSPKDGKRYATDEANIEQLFRIIQSVDLLVIPLKAFSYNVKKHFEGISFEGLY